MQAKARRVKRNAPRALSIDRRRALLKGIKAVRNLVDNKKLAVKASKGKSCFTVAVPKGGYVILATE